MRRAAEAELKAAGSGDREAAAWAEALTFHHQWMILARGHAAALATALRRDALQQGRAIHRACNGVRAGMAPDEFAVVTALRARGLVRCVARAELHRDGMAFPAGALLNCYPTLVLFPAEPSPHPVLWTDTTTAVNCQARCLGGFLGGLEGGGREREGYCFWTLLQRRRTLRAP